MRNISKLVISSFAGVMTYQTNFADFLEEYVQVVTEGDVVYLNASIYFHIISCLSRSAFGSWMVLRSFTPLFS